MAQRFADIVDVCIHEGCLRPSLAEEGGGTPADGSRPCRPYPQSAFAVLGKLWSGCHTLKTHGADSLTNKADSAHLSLEGLRLSSYRCEH